MRRPRGDDGAYAILYGLLLVIVLSTSAVVIDLASLREDRRQSRLASDSAAVAGARALDPLEGGDPYQACLDTWSYVSTNMDVPVAANTGCTVFSGLTTSPCPLTEKVAVGTSEGITVKVTWPVLQDSTLLTDPDVQGDAATGAQAIDTTVDGTAADACARLGVTVSQVHDQYLAGLFGVGDTTTSVTSVARAVSVPGNAEAIAALNVLNETTCKAIDMSGQAFLLIKAVGTRPGIISVESAGHQSGNDCPNNARYVIDAASNNAGGYIDAQGPGNVPGGGKILSFALNPLTTGNPADAFNPSLVPPAGTLLRPKPELLAARTGEIPVTDYLACNPCTKVSQNFITLLKSKFGSGTPQPYPYADAPYDTTVFKTLPGASVPAFNCTIGNNAKVLVPAGNYYVNCPTLTVSGTLVFAGGTVVTTGGIDVKGGCFASNVPLAVVAGGPACPGVSNGNVTTPPSLASMLYLRGGNFTTSGAYSILLPRTFVYMNSGHIDIASNATNVYWTNPSVTNPLCTSDECVSQRFAKVALWNTSNDQGQALGGQGSLTLRGVLFLPNAKFTYTGQAAQVQTTAQFWTDRIEIKGHGGLVMAPDPEASFASPVLGVVLIR
jgi:hypothetical protein